MTTLLYALGMDQDAIMAAYYDTVTFRKEGNFWATRFFPERLRGTKPTHDLVNAATGEVIAEAGKKITPRMVKEWQDQGDIAEVLVPFDAVVGRFAARDIINEETGLIWAEAGDELTWEIDAKTGDVTGGTLKVLLDNGVTEIPTLDVDNITVGAYIRNTMAADKNMNRDQALMDIYRVMRPGEPPTVDAADSMFQSLFFDPERYDLSAVGRVKMNMRLDLDAPDTMRTLRNEDIIACIKALVDLRDGKGEIDDIDHLGNRRVRSVGELMENQYRVGLLRMERAIRERMSSVEIDTVMPQDLDQRQARGGGGARVLRLLAAQPVHGSDQPALRGHPQAPPLGARAGRPDPRARRLRGPRRAPDPLRPHVPDRDAGRPEHRPDQLAGDLRAGQQVRLHRDPLSPRARRPGHRRGAVHVGDRGDAPHHRPGQRQPRRERPVPQRPGLHPQGRRLHAEPAAERRPDRRERRSSWSRSPPR